MFKRIITWMLIVFILATTLSACGGEGEETQTQAVTTGAEVVTTTDDGFVDDKLPEDIDYGGESVNILVEDKYEFVVFDAESATGENVVEDAVYYRNREVENRLGVDLNFIVAPTSGDVWSQRSAYMATVEQAANGNTGEYDILSATSRVVAGTVLGGYAVDLLEFDVIDFTAPWWSKSLIETSLVNGHLLYASGDICSSMIYMMNCTFFNTTMIADLGFESPYDLVDKNEWTIDKLHDMTTGLYTDLNGSFTKDASDNYGLIIFRDNLDAIYYGCGYMVIERVGDTLGFSEDFLGTGTRDYIVKMIEMFHETNDNYCWNNYAARDIFGANRALFLIDSPYCVYEYLDSYVDCIYGIVPVPKLDSTQAEYYSGQTFGYTTYTLFAGSPRLEIGATVLECMASEGYRKVTPAVFEITMKYQYALDDKASQMFDIIRDSIVFDFAREFAMDLPNTPNSMRWNAISANNKDWLGVVSKIERVMGMGLNKILGQLADYYD